MEISSSIVVPCGKHIGSCPIIHHPYSFGPNTINARDKHRPYGSLLTLLDSIKTLRSIVSLRPRLISDIEFVVE